MSAGEPNVPQFAGDPGVLGAKRLSGKVAIVTGAGSRTAGQDGPVIGNGRATAIMLAREGAKVALLDQQQDWVTETYRMIEDEGGEAIIVECDVASAESCQQAVQQVLDAYGTVNILVNNVGVTGPPGTAIDVDPEAFDRAM